MIEQFKVWLQDWEDVHIVGNKKKQPEKHRKGKSWRDTPNVNARACIISGPPGIGKSSSVKIISEHLGFETYFINASDKRSKTVVEGMLKDLCGSSTMDHFFKKKKNLRTVVVMDEIDGMSGGSSDKGGIPALIKIIKTT